MSEPEGGPHASPHRLVPREPDPERDQQGCAELEEQPDAHRQPRDRDEVEPLHDGEADDPVERQPAELAARPEPEALRCEKSKSDHQPEEASRRPKLGQRSVPMSLASSPIFATAPLTANIVAATIVIA